LLPYDYSALEPHIDTRTMAVHHDKHHQAYVNNLNKALENYPDLANKMTLELLSDLNSIPEEIQVPVRNHGGGHVNHSMFWSNMHSGGGGEPGGALAKDIDKAFGSFGDFQEAFSKSATTLFGVGWAWLCIDLEGKLVMTTTQNQDNPIIFGLLPLLGLDVWEHAYYLKYENRRADYVAAWWNVVNWGSVAGNLATARVELGVRDVALWAGDAWSKIEAVFSKSDDD
jgi:Fe-Mn family superoxide dismutase